jgi:hypothetical protein
MACEEEAAGGPASGAGEAACEAAPPGIAAPDATAAATWDGADFSPGELAARGGATAICGCDAEPATGGAGAAAAVEACAFAGACPSATCGVAGVSAAFALEPRWLDVISMSTLSNSAASIPRAASTA